MKATQKDFAAVAPRAVRACKTFFFCGPDEAGAAAAAQRIATMLEDPGERIELSGADLRRDPVLRLEHRSTKIHDRDPLCEARRRAHGRSRQEAGERARERDDEALPHGGFDIPAASDSDKPAPTSSAIRAGYSTHLFEMHCAGVGHG